MELKSSKKSSPMTPETLADQANMRHGGNFSFFSWNSVTTQ